MVSRKSHSLAAAQAILDGSFISEDMEKSALRVLEEGMKATVWTRTSTAAGMRYAEVPDHGIRVAAAVKVIEWRRGKPKAALELTAPPTSGASGPQDLLALAAQNPALAGRVMQTFAEMLNFSQAIPVQAVTSEPAQTS